jgi:type VI secretion system secreted protein Hcp
MAGNVDFYLKIDGIDGESADKKHPKEIELTKFSFGASQTGTMAYGGGGGAGKVAMDDFSFETKVSKASAKLQLACWSGQHIKKATLVCRRAGTEQQEYLKVTMSDILVSSYVIMGGSLNGTDPTPTEAVKLNFAKIEFEYKPQKEDGTLDAPAMAGWDLKQNVKV